MANADASAPTVAHSHHHVPPPGAGRGQGEGPITSAAEVSTWECCSAREPGEATEEFNDAPHDQRASGAP